MPVGEGDIAGVAEAAESGNAMSDAARDFGRGHEMLDGIDRADRNFGLQRRQGIHFLPEVHGIAQFAFGDSAQPLMLFAQDKWKAPRVETLAIALKNCVADVLLFKRQATRFDCEMSADRQAHEVDGICHGPSFIEVVDAPNQAAFEVAPGAEIFDVQIADCKHMRGFGKVGQDFRPELYPAVISSAEKGKEFGLHALMLEAKIRLLNACMVAEPSFELARGFDDVHGGNDSGGENEKSIGADLADAGGVWETRKIKTAQGRPPAGTPPCTASRAQRRRKLISGRKRRCAR